MSTYEVLTFNDKFCYISYMKKVIISISNNFSNDIVVKNDKYNF